MCVYVCGDGGKDWMRWLAHLSIALKLESYGDKLIEYFAMFEQFSMPCRARACLRELSSCLLRKEHLA